jgi:hypothetical protein
VGELISCALGIDHALGDEEIAEAGLGPGVECVLFEVDEGLLGRGVLFLRPLDDLVPVFLYVGLQLGDGGLVLGHVDVVGYEPGLELLLVPGFIDRC